MYQYDGSGVASALPEPAAQGAPGFFTDGSPSAGVPATILSADFMNTLMLELLNVVTAAGITPAKGQNNQVITAIQSMISGSETGVLPVARGGTGQGNLAPGEYLVGNGESGVSLLTAAQVLANIGGVPVENAALEGEPTAPTPAAGDNSQLIAPTNFVQAAIQAAIGNAVKVAIGAGTLEANILGLMVQIGSGSIAPSGSNSATGALVFPTAFPNQCLGVWPIATTNPVTSVGFLAILTPSAVSKTGATINADINADVQTHPINVTVNYTWLAFGN